MRSIFASFSTTRWQHQNRMMTQYIEDNSEIYELRYSGAFSSVATLRWVSCLPRHPLASSSKCRYGPNVIAGQNGRLQRSMTRLAERTANWNFKRPSDFR